MKANDRKVRIVSIEKSQGGLVTIRSDRSIEFSNRDEGKKFVAKIWVCRWTTGKV